MYSVQRFYRGFVDSPHHVYYSLKASLRLLNGQCIHLSANKIHFFWLGETDSLSNNFRGNLKNKTTNFTIILDFRFATDKLKHEQLLFFFHFYGLERSQCNILNFTMNGTNLMFSLVQRRSRGVFDLSMTHEWRYQPKNVKRNN